MDPQPVAGAAPAVAAPPAPARTGAEAVATATGGPPGMATAEQRPVADAPARPTAAAGPRAMATAGNRAIVAAPPHGGTAVAAQEMFEAAPRAVATSVPHVMYVCTGCNVSKSAAEAQGVRGGRKLWQALCAAAGRAGGAAVHLEPVACLSVCRDACAIALTAPGKYVYTIGWVAPDDAAAAELLAMARLYRDSPTGHVEQRERPRAARRLISRVPPPEGDPDRDDDAATPRKAPQVAKPPRAGGAG